jgi:hypothetical protein
MVRRLAYGECIFLKWRVVSLVDGFNLPVRISNTGGCGVAECTVNLNKDCPEALRGPVDANGSVAACKVTILSNLFTTFF